MGGSPRSGLDQMHVANGPAVMHSYPERVANGNALKCAGHWPRPRLLPFPSPERKFGDVGSGHAFLGPRTSIRPVDGDEAISRATERNLTRREFQQPTAQFLAGGQLVKLDGPARVAHGEQSAIWAQLHLSEQIGSGCGHDLSRAEPNEIAHAGHR